MATLDLLVQLGDEGMAITASRLIASTLESFDEPTLGVVNGDNFYFVANSHWSRFDRHNEFPDGFSGPIVLRVSVD